MKNQSKTLLDENLTHYIYPPSLLVRIKSSMIDTIIMIVLMFAATSIFESIHVDNQIVRIIAFVLILLYEPICTTLNRTLGQAMMGIRVKDFKTLSANGISQNISFIAALFRYAVKLSLGWVSFLTIHSDTHGRAIHDKIANSVVVSD
jgi:RDD family